MGQLVSFITPVYNAGEYLQVCIESLLQQTNGLWELVLVDDGSTDGSGDVCDNYAKIDERIKVIHKQNSGQFDSRLKGISIASGDYCTGLDADDYLEIDCVEIIQSVLNERNCDILCWDIRSVTDGKETNREMMPRYGEYTNVEFLEYVVASTNYSFCNKLIRTELLRNSYFGDVPKKTRHSEDYILVCPSLCMSSSVYAIKNVLYNYRQIEGSVTHKYDLQRVYDYLDSSVCIRNIIAKYGLLTPAIEAAEDKSLITPVGSCLKYLYKHGLISSEQQDRVREHPIYKRLGKYEKINNATFDVIVFLKLFRYRFDVLLMLVYGNSNG